MTDTRALAASISTEDRATYWRAYHAAGGDTKAVAKAAGLPDRSLIVALEKTHGWAAELEAIRSERIRAMQSVVVEQSPAMELTQRAAVQGAAVTEQDIGKRLKDALADPKTEVKDIAALAKAKSDQGRSAVDGVKAWKETWGEAKAAAAVQVNVDASQKTINIGNLKQEDFDAMTPEELRAYSDMLDRISPTAE